MTPPTPTPLPAGGGGVHVMGQSLPDRRLSVAPLKEDVKSPAHPRWLNAAIDWLWTIDKTPKWRILIMLWAEHEAALRFAENKRLPTWARPPQVYYWQKRARKFDCIPVIDSIESYGCAVIGWYESMQPNFRRGPGFHMWREGDASDFDTLNASGVNGIFILIMTVAWWLYSVNNLDTSTDAERRTILHAEVMEFVEDISWMFTQIHPTAPFTMPSTLSSDPSSPSVVSSTALPPVLSRAPSPAPLAVDETVSPASSTRSKRRRDTVTSVRTTTGVAEEAAATTTMPEGSSKRRRNAKATTAMPGSTTTSPASSTGSSQRPRQARTTTAAATTPKTSPGSSLSSSKRGRHTVTATTSSASKRRR
ncbi:hypothetical protein EWM64_g7902 [Hericium alpestre]|uniref:Uncharacterized protein n=1 Tax=Hericium alpestre TaxID=135208 RepID=A0A4Y9ZPC7_9AGAM|nr:hypothetical protein EWM64_g7902 [Hericium alpestre]